MPSEALQCPKCGSPQPAESAPACFNCSYCRTRLRLALGPSGLLLRACSSADAETMTLALRLAIELLEQRVQGLVEKTDALRGQCDKDVQAAVAQYGFLRLLRNWVVVGGAVLTAVGAMFSPWLAANALIVVAVLVAWPWVEKQRLRAEEQARVAAAHKYERTLVDIEHQIQFAREQMRRLEQALDGPPACA